MAHRRQSVCRCARHGCRSIKATRALLKHARVPIEVMVDHVAAVQCRSTPSAMTELAMRISGKKGVLNASVRRWLVSRFTSPFASRMLGSKLSRRPPDHPVHARTDRNTPQLRPRYRPCSSFPALRGAPPVLTSHAHGLSQRVTQLFLQRQAGRIVGIESARSAARRSVAPISMCRRRKDRVRKNLSDTSIARSSVSSTRPWAERIRLRLRSTSRRRRLQIEEALAEEPQFLQDPSAHRPSGRAARRPDGRTHPRARVIRDGAVLGPSRCINRR